MKKAIKLQWILAFACILFLPRFGACGDEFLRLEGTFFGSKTLFSNRSYLEPQISKDGKFAVTGTDIGIQLWDLSAGNFVCKFSPQFPKLKFHKRNWKATSMAISPDFQDLAVTIRVEEETQFVNHKDSKYTVMFILDPCTLVEKKRFVLDPLVKAGKISLQWSSDGKNLFLVNEDYEDYKSSFYSIDSKTSKILLAYKLDKNLTGWSISPNAKKAAFCYSSGEREGQIVIMDLETADIKTTDVNYGLLSILFTGDTELITGENRGQCKVRKWEFKDGILKEGQHIEIKNRWSYVDMLRYDPINDTICVYDNDSEETWHFYSYAKFGVPKCSLSFKGKNNYASKNYLKFTFCSAQNKLYAFYKRKNENTLSLDSYVFERGTENLSEKVASKDYDNFQSQLAFGNLSNKEFFDSFAEAGYEYWKKESNAGNSKGQFLYACCLLNGFNGIKLEKRGLELLQLSAEQGNYLSLILLASRSKEKPEEAFVMYKKAAETKNPLALEYLADCHRLGLGTPKDFEKAFQLSLKSAASKNGLPYSMYNVGLAYFDAVGTVKSLENAFNWFSKAADARFADANYFVGLCYLEGLGVKSDAEMAFKSFNKGKQLNSLPCTLMLAQCYESGTGCKPDPIMAYDMYYYLVNEKKIDSVKPKLDALGKKIQPYLDDRLNRFLGSIGGNSFKNISPRSTANLKSHAVYEAQMAAWEAQRDHRNRTAGMMGALGLSPLSIGPPPTRPIDYDR